MKELISRAVVWLWLFTVPVIAITGFYWQYLDEWINPPVTIPIRDSVNIGKVRAGQSIEINRNYCTNTKTPGIVKRVIVDGFIYQLPSTITIGEIGCFHDKKFIVDIPKGLKPGKYIYKVSISFDINPIKTVTVDLPHVHFEVIK